MTQELFVAGWVGFAVLTALVASMKRQPVPTWFLLGLVGGVIALALVIVMPAKRA